jgi:glutamate dehydrogenase (NAD(P)+)
MQTVLTYADPVEDVRGWLVYDGGNARIAAGGCRVQPGLTLATLRTLAERMTLKQRVLGLRVDGAKCGIDYDPGSPGKETALRRFLAFLATELTGRLSLGCDMGTQWSELERLAAGLGIPSVKYAIRRAQGFADEEFFARLRLLDHPVGPLTLGARRAGHALAHATLASLGPRLPAAPTVTLQGFGNLGRAAAYTFAEQGARVVAVSDEFGCVVDPAGLDVHRMATAGRGVPLPEAAGRPAAPRDALFDVASDALILAAGEDAMDPTQALAQPSPAVVVGANCGLRPESEAALASRGTVVVPDFIGGIGGSASMEALFGTVPRPSAREVLDGTASMMHALVGALAGEAAARGVTLSEVARERARAAPSAAPPGPPYGVSPWLPRRHPSSIRRQVHARGKATLNHFPTEATP